MIKEFWIWFQQNEREICRTLIAKDQSDENILNDLGQELEKISPQLGFEIISGNPETNKRFILTISCGGARSLYIQVQTLKSWAPKIKNWKIKAFIKPKGKIEDMLLEPYPLFDWNVIPNYIKFAIYNYDLEKEIYEVILLLPLSLREKEESSLKEYFYNMFQDLWGEKFIGRRINDIYLTFYPDENYYFLEMEHFHFVFEEFKLFMGME